MTRWLIPAGVIVLHLAIYASGMAIMVWIRATSGDTLGEADKIVMETCKRLTDATLPSLLGCLIGIAAAKVSS